MCDVWFSRNRVNSIRFPYKIKPRLVGEQVYFILDTKLVPMHRYFHQTSSYSLHVLFISWLLIWNRCQKSHLLLGWLWSIEIGRVNFLYCLRSTFSFSSCALLWKMEKLLMCFTLIRSWAVRMCMFFFFLFVSFNWFCKPFTNCTWCECKSATIHDFPALVIFSQIINCTISNFIRLWGKTRNMEHKRGLIWYALFNNLRCI